MVKNAVIVKDDVQQQEVITRISFTSGSGLLRYRIHGTDGRGGAGG